MQEPTPALTKVCTSCQQAKSIEAFDRDGRTKDGLRFCCRFCRDAQDEAKRAASIEKSRLRWREYARARRAADPEAMRAKARAWYAAHPDANPALSRAWRAAHPERQAESERRWREANPEKVAAKGSRQTARRRGAKVGSVDVDALWTGRCGICEAPMDRALAYPDPLSKSLDHIIPIVLGGSHEQSNLSWTHLVCNKRKGARLTT